MKQLFELFKRKATILLYHSIADVEHDPFALHVSPYHFESQLKIIKKYFNPISVNEMIDCLLQSNRELPRRAIVLTFDDGYANNLNLATPLLEQYQIPATLFVTTETIKYSTEYWWDILEQLILEGPPIPASLLNDQKLLTKKLKISLLPEASTLDLYFSVWNALYTKDDQQRQQYLGSLSMAARKEIKTRASHRSLSKQELLELQKSPIWTIGAHTLTHPPLEYLEPEKQKIEIKDSKTFLETVLKKEIPFFSYPHGSYSPVTVATVVETGFQAAFTTEFSSISNKSDVMKLPRIQIGNWSKVRFLNCLLS